MISLRAVHPLPLADTRQRSRASFLVALALRLVLAAALVAVAVGGAEAVLWEPSGAKDQVPVSDTCPEPPCLPESLLPESLPEVKHLPVVIPPLGYLLAAALGAAALLTSLLSNRRLWTQRRLLPVLGPLVVLVAMEVVPHVINPCLAAGALGGDLPAGCSRTVHGVDVHDRWHALHHAVVGGLPAALGYTATLRRRRPELFARSDDPSRSLFVD